MKNNYTQKMKLQNKTRLRNFNGEYKKYINYTIGSSITTSKGSIEYIMQETLDKK